MNNIEMQAFRVKIHAPESGGWGWEFICRTGFPGPRRLPAIKEPNVSKLPRLIVTICLGSQWKSDNGLSNFCRGKTARSPKSGWQSRV